MKLDRNYRLWRAAGDSFWIPALSHAYLDMAGARPLLFATEGHILVAVPVETEPGDTPGPVTRTALRHARTPRHADQAQIACSEQLVAHGLNDHGAEQLVVERPKTTPPDWREVGAAEPARRLRICINPSLLVRIARAVGGHADAPVALDVGLDAEGNVDVEAPVVVGVQHAPAHFAVLMLSRDVEDRIQRFDPRAPVGEEA